MWRPLFSSRLWRLVPCSPMRLERSNSTDERCRVVETAIIVNCDRLVAGCRQFPGRGPCSEPRRHLREAFALAVSSLGEYLACLSCRFHGFIKTCIKDTHSYAPEVTYPCLLLALFALLAIRLAWLICCGVAVVVSLTRLALYRQKQFQVPLQRSQELRVTRLHKSIVSRHLHPRE